MFLIHQKASDETMTSKELSKMKSMKAKVLDGLKIHQFASACAAGKCPYFKEACCSSCLAKDAEWLISQMDKRIAELDDLVETVCLGG